MCGFAAGLLAWLFAFVLAGQPAVLQPVFGLSGLQPVWLSVRQAGLLAGWLAGWLAGLLSGCASLLACASWCALSCLLCGCGLFRQGSSASVEKFSVRGDGLVTATTAEAGVSAVVAHATDGATYTGTVLVAQSVRASDTGFYLFKVRGGATSGLEFDVWLFMPCARADGCGV